jgi:ribonucleoside-diphosphate reductase alpha chain
MTKELRQKKLPKTRTSITHEFVISGIKGFVTVGMYADGKPGEVFIAIAKEGSTLGGLFNAISIITSMALQHGVSIDKLAAKLSYMSFPPQGFTGEDFGYASSIVDYIFRWLGKTFGTKEIKEQKMIDTDLAQKIKETPAIDKPIKDVVESNFADDTESLVADSPPCHNCGGLTKRSGSCHVCTNCGETSGCS